MDVEMKNFDATEHEINQNYKHFLHSKGNMNQLQKSQDIWSFTMNQSCTSKTF